VKRRASGGGYQEVIMEERLDQSISRRRFIRGVSGITTSAVVGLFSRTSGPLQAATAAPRSSLPAQLRELEELVLGLMKQSVVPGLSIAVVKDGAVVWDRAFGVRDAASGAPVDEQTVFEAASVSKTVFASAVMQLRDRGVLDLDTPLTGYTPERILDGDPRLDLITARHVLSHTSGLPDFRSRAKPLRIHFTPGERFQYSGEGYWYLQTVVTHLVGTTNRQRCATYEAGLRVCATDIDAYLTANVLVPCRMESSGYVWNETFEQHAARPHDAAGRPLPLTKPTATDAARYAAMGGLRTTALDYAHFLIAVIAPQASRPFRLSPASRQEMFRPQVSVDESNSWGLGWEIHRTAGGTLIQHQGGQTGVQAFTAASVVQRSGYVILTNSANGWKVFYDDRFVTLIDQVLLA
jgi:CubicO group peptidase (beta-lactamase class C family)